MTHHQIKAAVSRLRRLFALWDGKLDDVDKEFALRRIRDEAPGIFWKIATESPRGEAVREKKELT